MDTMNVTAAKPKVEGAVFAAPLTSTLTIPDDASTALAQAFKELGYASEDGIRNTFTPESEEVKAWGGDIVLTPVNGRADKWTVKLIEANNDEVIKIVYGSGNVDITASTTSTPKKIEVAANAGELGAYCWVFEMILKAGGIRRVVLPNAKVTEIGEVTYKDNEPIGYELTLTCMPDEDGNTHYEYTEI